MNIERPKDLALLKRTCVSHMVVLSKKSMKADRETGRDYLQTELDDTIAMIEAIDINLKRQEPPRDTLKGNKSAVLSKANA